MKEYPKMLYAAGGMNPKQVLSRDEESRARAEGLSSYVEATAVIPPVQAGPRVVPPPTEQQWSDLRALMTYGRSIGMTLGPKYRLETLQEKVRAHLTGQE